MGDTRVRKEPDIKQGWNGPSSSLGIGVTIAIEGKGTFQLQVVLDDKLTAEFIRVERNITADIYEKIVEGIPDLQYKIVSLKRGY